MTKKRFTFHHDVDGIDYIEDESNGFCLICDELMCSLLNEQHETIERFKQNIDELLSVDIEEELLKENEQLKSYTGEMENYLARLEEENEQLRQEKQLLYENIDFLKKFIEKQGFKVKLDDKLFRVI